MKESIRKCGVFTPRWLGQRRFHRRWPALDTSTRTAAPGGCPARAGPAGAERGATTAPGGPGRAVPSRSSCRREWPSPRQRRAGSQVSGGSVVATAHAAGALPRLACGRSTAYSHRGRQGRRRAGERQRFAVPPVPGQCRAWAEQPATHRQHVAGDAGVLVAASRAAARLARACGTSRTIEGQGWISCPLGGAAAALHRANGERGLDEAKGLHGARSLSEVLNTSQPRIPDPAAKARWLQRGAQRDQRSGSRSPPLCRRGRDAAGPPLRRPLASVLPCTPLASRCLRSMPS